ncbi:MAG: outer membrane beta-barrel protein [Flavobacteriales bacterium]|nr:outer membrane beta-barrel protein [Flavobacteriales bacterium]
MKKWLIIFTLLPALALAQETDHFAKKNTLLKKLVPNTRSTEFGIFGGVSYYNGDVNPASQFNPELTNWAVGVILRRNLNSRWALRLNGMYGNLKGNDLTSSSVSQQQRGISFTSVLYEISGQAEFNFFPYCVANDEIYFSPYLFIGLGGFRFNTTNGSGQEVASLKAEDVDYAKTAVMLPFGVGIKAKLSSRFLIGAEWGFRKTWTDYIDDVSTTYASTGRQRGNSKTNDYYNLAGITLTARLGPKLSSCWKQ